MTEEPKWAQAFTDSVIFSETVSMIPAMTSNQKVFHLIFLLLGLISISRAQNEGINDAVKRIFLTKHFNSTDSEFILKSARESYLLLKDVERKFDDGEKLNFVKSYANFLLKLLEELKEKEFDIYQLFSKENSFLKGYTPAKISGEFDKDELKTKIYDLQVVAERFLITYYNSTRERYDALYVLDLNQTSFDGFLNEKLRADYAEIGYFFLEVFATLIGLSWGIISTAIYYSETNHENVLGMHAILQ